jgi:hypothetical protein
MEPEAQPQLRPPQQQHKGLFDWLGSHPVIPVGIAIFAALVIAALFLNKQNATSAATTTPTTAGDLSGVQLDANGNPIVYSVGQDEFYNYNYVEDSYNNTITGSYDNPVTNTTTTNTTTSITNNGGGTVTVPDISVNTYVPQPSA